MKTVLDKLSDEKAGNEVGKFTYVCLAVSVATLFAAWPLAAISVILGPREFLLTYHKGNKGRKDLSQLRIMSGLAVVIALISLVRGYAK
jgi:hypothetical protein